MKGAAERPTGELTVYVDGASRGNPGSAGAGIVIVDEHGRVVREIATYLGRKTNNQAEYAALILALEAAQALAVRRVRILLDSELVVRQARGEYRVCSPLLRPLWARVQQLSRQFCAVSFAHVGRGANGRAHALAARAASVAKGSSSPLASGPLAPPLSEGS